jgi:cell wall-associated NlpC family hydrolase
MELICGFCNIAQIPVRAVASHRSEMVTQLLFGEAYRITDVCSHAEWIGIRTQFDHYSGFIDIRQTALLHPSAYEQYVEKQYPVAHSPVQLLDVKRNLAFTVPIGSTLAANHADEMILGRERFRIPSLPAVVDGNVLERLQSVACSFLNAPYLWGGRTAYGIDCSGLTQIIFKVFGLALPRDARQQATWGKTVDFTAVATGDLAFFANKEGKIIHTAMLLDPHRVIHASGKVRIDPFDEYGIYCTEREEYSHRLLYIKRLSLDFLQI